jgi:hypothetical protein
MRRNSTTSNGIVQGGSYAHLLTQNAKQVFQVPNDSAGTKKPTNEQMIANQISALLQQARKSRNSGSVASLSNSNEAE